MASAKTKLEPNGLMHKAIIAKEKTALKKGGLLEKASIKKSEGATEMKAVKIIVEKHGIFSINEKVTSFPETKDEELKALVQSVLGR